MTPDPAADRDPLAEAWDGLSPPYATIVVDPPWPYEGDRPPFGPTSHGDQGWARKWAYSLMTLGEIAALPVQDLAQPGAHLYLWTTNRYLWDARDVALGWGFEPSKVLVWCKEPMGLGLGGLFAQTTEFIVFAQRAIRARREVERAGELIRFARLKAGLNRAELHRLIRGGKPTGIVHRWEDDDSLPNARDWVRLQEVLPRLRGVERPYVPPPEPRERNRIDTSWWLWKRGPHSAKPPPFLDVVEQVSPAPRVELFARAQRLGWDSWGWGYEGVAS